MPLRRSHRLIAAVVIVAVFALAPGACGSSSTTSLTPTPTRTQRPTETPTPTNTPTPTTTPSPTPTSTPVPTPTDTPTPVPTDTPVPPPTDTPVPEPAEPITATVPAETPGDGGGYTVGDCSQPVPPQSAIRGRRIVAFYGTTGPGLGILGRFDIASTLTMLFDQLQPYRDMDPCVETIPGFHIITTVADANPGADGDYSHRIDHESVRMWIDGVAAVGGVSILDIQVGRGDIGVELSLLEPLLLIPGVHLAVDPEFINYDGEVPGSNLGHINGEMVNYVQSWLNGIAEQTGENKILVIHQFDDRMIWNKAVIQDYPLVDLVWDADGFGGPGAKIGDYNQYKGEAGFEYGGFKVFYRYDTPPMTVVQVLALQPPPAYVLYQ